MEEPIPAVKVCGCGLEYITFNGKPVEPPKHAHWKILSKGGYKSLVNLEEDDRVGLNEEQ